MSGIITSSRLASGCSAFALIIPSAPELAVMTRQFATTSSPSWVTSRISSSSSMTKMLLLVSIQVPSLKIPSLMWHKASKQTHHALFELVEGDAALGEKLCVSQLQLLPLLRIQIFGRIHHQRDLPQLIMLLQPIGYEKSITLGQNQI